MNLSLEGIVNAVFRRNSSDVVETHISQESEECINPILEFRRNFAEKHGRGHQATVDNAVYRLSAFINFVDPMRVCDLEIYEVDLDSPNHINGISGLEIVFKSGDRERVAYLNYNANLCYQHYIYTPAIGCATTRSNRSEKGLASFRNDDDRLNDLWHPARSLKEAIDLDMRLSEDRHVELFRSLEAA